MSQIILNIPDDKETRFINAFAKVFGWDTKLEITKKQFFKRKLKDYMKDVVFRSEISEVNNQASRNLQTELDGIEVT